MKSIEVTNLIKKFGDEIILDNINFSANAGKIISIIGASGKGKSTFLRCLAGLETIDSGSIKINGKFLVKDRKYVSKKEQKNIFKNVGLVFQNFNLFNNLTVKENIEIPLKNQKTCSYAEISHQSKYLIDRFKLAGRENFYPKSLSGGQKQRVAIARALVLNPKILLFDEPTSALDKELTEEIEKILKELSKENYTIIVVTHQIEFASKVSNEILRLKDKNFHKELI